MLSEIIAGRQWHIGYQCFRGQVLAEVIELESLQAILCVLERDGGGVAKGKEVSLRPDSLPEKTFEGIVRSVSSLPQSREPNSPLRLFMCDATIQGVGKYLKNIRPEMVS